MRIHFVLNHDHDNVPASKLADVEIHFEEGLLDGLKLVGCSVWRSRKGDVPTVLIPARSYHTAAGVRYYELLRPSTNDAKNNSEGKHVVTRLKDFIRAEYRKIAERE